MNAAVKVLPRGRLIAIPQPHTIIFSLQQGLILLTLLGLTLLSAFAVVYVKDLNRRLFIEYQTLQDTQNQLNVDWSRLLLEQSVWSTHVRIQAVAEQRLSMEIPAPKNRIMVQD